MKEYIGQLNDAEATKRAPRAHVPPPSSTPQPATTPAVRITSHTAEPVSAELQAQRIEQSIYLHSSRWDELLVTDADGMPPLRLVPHNGRLWFREDTTGKLVKVANRKLPRLGIWSVKVRGWTYYPDAIANSRIAIYEPVSLVREPDNEFDKNAIAVHTSAGTIGHFNKQMAARLAKRLDAGEELVAFITSDDVPPNVIAAAPEVMAYLRRR